MRRIAVVGVALEAHRAIGSPGGQAKGAVANQHAALGPAGVATHHAGARIDGAEALHQLLWNRKHGGKRAQIQPVRHGALQFHHQRSVIGRAQSHIFDEALRGLLPQRIGGGLTARTLRERLQCPGAPREERACTTDVHGVARVVGGQIRQQRALPREHEVPARERGSVAPSQVGPQVKGPRAAVLAALPAFGGGGHHLAGHAVDLGQALEQRARRAHIMLIGQALRIQREGLGGVGEHHIGARRRVIPPQRPEHQRDQQQDGCEQAHGWRACRGSALLGAGHEDRLDHVGQVGHGGVLRCKRLARRCR